MDGRREGENRLVALSDCEKRPRHTLVVIYSKDDTLISRESLLLGMLGLCWAEESSSERHQPGQQPQASVFLSGRVC